MTRRYHLWVVPAMLVALCYSSDRIGKPDVHTILCSDSEAAACASCPLYRLLAAKLCYVLQITIALFVP